MKEQIKNTVEYQSKKFSNVLKGNNIRDITSFIITKNPALRHKDKVDTIIANLCRLNISNIADIIKLMKLKATDGSDMPLYIKAVDCKPEIFGFIHAYFSVSKHLRFSAYGYAALNNRIDILRKIRDIEPKYFEKIYQYITESKDFSKEVKEFVREDYKKTKSKKDRSPEDFLRYKQKKEVKRKFTEHNKRKAIYIKKEVLRL